MNEAALPARDKYFAALEKFLKKSTSGYLVGSKVSWADLVIADSLATFHSFIPTLFDGHSEVKNFVDHVRDLPNIKKWIEERPETPF